MATESADKLKRQRGADKVARIPVKIAPRQERYRLPEWIRARAPTGPEVARVKALLRQQRLHTVCEEASCPNLGECFNHGTATFMILGDICTRRCPFCDVAHGRPAPPDEGEPERLAASIATLGLNFVVLTSVDRDDLRDGGAGHFAKVIGAIRHHAPATSIEILTPDFRGREAVALDHLAPHPPDIFNHNLETVPRLYQEARPGASYQGSLNLLKQFSQRLPTVPTKSGLMVGLGELPSEIEQVLHDLYQHGCRHLTLGQYLAPSRDHLPVKAFIRPEQFAAYAALAREIGFTRVASAPLVRSSYHAEAQARGEGLG
ncbi:lipoyl synthase [Ectothiorhodospiraceae bacterium BW-2]|nr:lipoyl synthase [Ectothiorhodospiraceae bacterium BW-2]